ELERRRPEPYEMRVDAVQLAQERAHPCRLRRDLEFEELLDGADEHVLVVLEGDVVDALGVRDALPPRLLLHVLLEPGMQVADHGLDPGDVLAVEVDDQAQDAVRRRVVRPEVDRLDVAGRLQLRRGAKHRRRRAGNARALVDLRARGAGCGGCHSSPENLTGSPPSGESLRSGCPSQSSSSRMRFRLGWPSIAMPIRSHASRSCQSAVGQTPITEATGSPSSSQVWSRTRRGSAAIASRW